MLSTNITTSYIQETDGNIGGKCIESEEETKPRGISISQLRKNYEAKEEPQVGIPNKFSKEKIFVSLSLQTDILKLFLD